MFATHWLRARMKRRIASLARRARAGRYTIQKSA
jgi:hypothetical protein